MGLAPDDLDAFLFRGLGQIEPVIQKDGQFIDLALSIQPELQRFMVAPTVDVAIDIVARAIHATPEACNRGPEASGGWRVTSFLDEGSVNGDATRWKGPRLKVY